MPIHIGEFQEENLAEVQHFLAPYATSARSRAQKEYLTNPIQGTTTSEPVLSTMIPSNE
jgi:hypothetical protein